jgi:hypothetical protein
MEEEASSCILFWKNLFSNRFLSVQLKKSCGKFGKKEGDCFKIGLELRGGDA